MSLIQFNKKPKQQKLLEAKTGIVIIDEPYINDDKHKLFFCITNALIMFLMFEGMIGLILKSFEVPVNMFVVTVCNILICLFYSFFYYNTWIKIVGYIIVLLGFSYMIINFGIIIRSGFGAITNIFMEYIEDKLDLPIQREYTEYFKDRYISVTFCMIAMILAFGLMFNIVISEVKGSAFVVLMTFPVVQLPIYFDKKIDVIYLTLYVMSLIVLFALRSTKHYKLETKKKNGYEHKVKKNSRIYDYVTDGRTSVKMLMLFVIYVLVVVIVIGTIFPQEKFEMSTKYDEMKDNTEDVAKKIALVGLWGMLVDGSSGGISRNRLGDSRYVKFDFQPDLYVTVPDVSDVEDIYLKGFVGTIYRDNSWKIRSEMEGYAAITDIGYEKSLITKRLLSRCLVLGKSVPYIQLKITNVGANPNYIYTGYYENDTVSLYEDMSEEDNPIGKFSIGNTITDSHFYWDARVSYLAANEFAKNLYEDNKDRFADIYYAEEQYRKYVYNNYLDVPDENAKVIDEIIKNNELDKSEDVVESVKQYFYDNYEYTLIPGKTPKKKDSVNYFLTENKKGYCSYFASSAVLMFRRMGIPARYVGGYHISKSDITSGNDTKEKISEYYYHGSEGEVKEVEVNDSCAHAWVEVYVDKLGFIPVDVTPPSDDDESEEIEKEQNKSTFVKMMNAIFSPSTAQTVKNTTVIFGVLCVIFVLLGIILYVIVSYFVTKARKKRFIKNRESVDNIFRMNKYLFRMFETIKCKKEAGETYKEYGDRMASHGYCSEADMEELIRIYEKAKYSNNKIDALEFEKYYDTLYNIRENMYVSLKWHKKIIFRYIKML